MLARSIYYSNKSEREGFMNKLRNLKLFSLVCILAVFLVFFVINIVHAKKGKPEPQIPFLNLSNVNIVTAQAGGPMQLNVWGNSGEYDYEHIWTAEGIHHPNVAMGDADNDGITEIVAPTYRRVGGKGGAYREIFFNVYKDGEEGIWKSSEAFRESSYPREITIADVGGIPGNEVVMITDNKLVTFKYSNEFGEFGIISKIDLNLSSIVPGQTLILRSVTAGNIDLYYDDEIFVSANVKGGGQGYVLVFDYCPDEPMLINEISIDAGLSLQSLRVGDLDADGFLEICSTGYRKVDDLYNTFIFIWNAGGESLCDEKIFGNFELPHLIFLDVGDIGEGNGDEILVGSCNVPISLFGWDETGLAFIRDVTPEDIHPGYRMGINNVNIADAGGGPEKEIIVCGLGRAFSDSNRKGKPPKTVNDFYLEVFDANLDSLWSRVGGDSDKDEYEVWYAAIGKK